MDQCDHQINFPSICRSVTYILWSAKLLHVLKTIYSRKVVLGKIDQCHSENDIVNYILPYIIVINFKIFYNQEMAPARGICDPLGTCSR